MFLVSNICKNTYVSTFILVQVRTKTKTHWAKLKKKTGPKYKAQSHFDDFYGSVFGEKWAPMKEAMLRRSKYVAVINNYGDAEETVQYLTNRGAHCLKNLMTVQQEFHKEYTPITQTQTKQDNNKLELFAASLQTDEISNLYPQTVDAPEKLDLSDITLSNKEDENMNVADTQNIDKTQPEQNIDDSRIIDPALGMTSEALYQFLPATKLKGMEEWIPESVHYAYYSKAQDFPLVIEQESEFIYPEHLKVYTYEKGSEWTTFPEPKRDKTGVYNYYPMDCGSVLAVLALGLRAGDRVLDLCSAPGGKALVALQTLLPDVIVCNDVSISRGNRTQRIFRDYLFDFETSNKWRERVVFTKVDGRNYIDDQGFDKVLVDVPCTTDRLSMKEDDNNIFRPDRIKERLRLPELQAQLLTNALQLVKVGGTVVYSTCSLSPIQNDGVVHLGLKNAFVTRSIVATVKDLTTAMSSFSSTLELGTDSTAPKYGQLVTPCQEANFGPSYIAKLVRVK